MAGRHGEGRGTACETETETPHLVTRRVNVSFNPTGFLGVHRQKNKSKPDTFSATVTVGVRKQAYLGTFATAEEAALCIAQSPEGQAAAEKSDKQQAAKRKFSASILGKPTKGGQFGEAFRMKVEESGLSGEELAQRQQELFAEARQLLPTRASSVPGSSSDHLASGGQSSARTAWGPPPPQRSTSITEVLDELAAKRQLSGEGRPAGDSTAELSMLRTSAAGGGSGIVPPSTCHCPPSQSRTHAAVDDRPQQPTPSRHPPSRHPPSRHPPWTAASASAVWDGARGDGGPGDVWRVRGWGGGAANAGTANAGAANAGTANAGTAHAGAAPSGYACAAATAAPHPSRQRSGGVAVAVRVGDVLGGGPGMAAATAAAAAASAAAAALGVATAAAAGAATTATTATAATAVAWPRWS